MKRSDKTIFIIELALRKGISIEDLVKAVNLPKGAIKQILIRSGVTKYES